jgi:hypothetical protein
MAHPIFGKMNARSNISAEEPISQRFPATPTLGLLLSALNVLGLADW